MELEEFYNSKTDKVFATLNSKTKRMEYNIQNGEDGTNTQLDFIINPIVIEGFSNIPSGFYKEGYGFTPSTSWRNFLPIFKDIFKSKFKIRVTSDEVLKVDQSKKTLILPHRIIKELIRNSKITTSIKNTKIKNYTKNIFADNYSKIERPSETYVKGELATIEGTIKTAASLSTEDVSALINIYTKIGDQSGKVTQRDLTHALENKSAVENVYLKKVIQYFEKNLKEVKSESFWQRFLAENLLLFNNNYVALIEKQNISLSIKIPDFLLLDQFGYLDVFEIKKPQTSLLKYDKSRNNYYWSDEISKAISQVENYINELTRSADRLMVDFSKKDLKIEIIRPKAVIIAGTTSELKLSKKHESDFRILSQSSKNIQFVLFDEYLSSLKNLSKKIGG